MIVFVRLYISSLLFFYLVIVPSRKEESRGVYMRYRRRVFIHLFSIKVVDKPTKLCLASRSLKQGAIYWLYCVILSHCQNCDVIIMLLCHLTIPDSRMMSTKLRNIAQGCKTTSLISSFQKRGHNRLYNCP